MSKDKETLDLALAAVLSYKEVVFDAQSKQMEAIASSLDSETKKLWNKLTQKRSTLAKLLQKKQDQLQSFLPKPLDGWTSEDESPQAVGTAMLIGGASAKRSYYKGSSIITIGIIADSPFLQSIMTLFNIPLISTASGGKLEIVKGQKAIVTYKSIDQQGEIKIIVVGRILITLNGRNVSKQDIIDYANEINYKKIATFY